MEERRLDTKTLIAFALMSVLLMWMMFNNQTENTSTQNPPETPQNVATTPAQPTAVEQLSPASDSLPTPQSETFTQLENDLLRLTFSNKGGQMVEALVKNQKTFDSEPVYLVKDGNASFGLEFLTTENKLINTRDLFFEASQQGNTVSMKLKRAAHQFVEFRYTLRPAEYMVDFQILSEGMSGQINHSKNPLLVWDLTARRMEKSVTYEDRYTEAMAHYTGDKLEKLSASGSDTESVKGVNWVGFKQHLFSSFLISETDFSQADLTSEDLVKGDEPTEKFTKKFSATLQMPLPAGELQQQMHWYVGPSDYHILKGYSQYGIAQSIPLGWGIFGWINKYFVIPVFDFLSQYMSVGLAIIVLTIVVRILLSPVQYKSYLSQAKMKILRPEIEEINQKYKEPMKRQQETMALYNKAGVNPMSGCVPALLQMPVFFALFSFFPSAFILRNKHFLWAEDLSSYDAIFELPFSIPFYGSHVSLFPILASAAIFVYMMMTSGQMQQPQQEGVPNMKFMMYLSPLMMLFFFNNYASGLSLYYFISNLITIFIMLAIKYWIIDEKRILAKIEENKQKPKKESKFQRRLREMMEQAEAQKKAQRK